MREPPALPEERLRACLCDAWGRIPSAVEFLPLGLDTRAGVYRVTLADGAVWLVKVKGGPLYAPGCLVPAWLSGQGIPEVVAPLPTSAGALWTTSAEWTVIAYPFIEGDTGWGTITEAHWEATGRVFSRIHQISPPTSGFEALRRETFDPVAYAQAIRAYEDRAAAEPRAVHPAEQALQAIWRERQPTIHAILARMERLAPVLLRAALRYVICHADLHPGNLLRDPHGGVHIIDWDDVMLAPRERDFIFVGDTRSPGATGPAPFFRGYGAVEIDWRALTYYRYERIIQDVVACIEDVCFRDDLGDEARADAAALLGDVLADGGMIAGAEVAAGQLPPGLLTP